MAIDRPPYRRVSLSPTVNILTAVTMRITGNRARVANLRYTFAIDVTESVRDIGFARSDIYTT